MYCIPIGKFVLGYWNPAQCPKYIIIPTIHSITIPQAQGLLQTSRCALWVYPYRDASFEEVRRALCVLVHNLSTFCPYYSSLGQGNKISSPLSNQLAPVDSTVLRRSLSAMPTYFKTDFITSCALTSSKCSSLAKISCE
jgi:hypothetical protein